MLKQAPYAHRLISYTQMTPAEWSLVADNPRQRDTEMHAKPAMKYLIAPKPPHIEVKMAWLPDGSKIKLDGHTRSWLWDRQLIPVPEMLDVSIYRLVSREEVFEAYDWFDNAQAAERGGHVVQGAFRANGLHPVSHMVRSGRINTALVRLYRFVTEANQQWNYETISEAVRYFSKEVMLLDTLQPTGKLFPTGIVMAFLITTQRDKEDAYRFWSEYAAERGQKNDGKLDAIQALTESVTTLKTGGRGGTKDTVSEIFKRALAAFFGYQRGHIYMASGSGLRPVSDPTARRYIHKIKL